MAIIGKQTKIIKVLDRLEMNTEFYHSQDPNLQKAGSEVYVSEEILIKSMLEKYPCRSRHDWNRVLESCIEDELIESVENKHFNPNASRDNFDMDVLSRRILRVSAGKGVELLNWRYRWFKHIASAFPDWARVCADVAISALTSGAIWWYVVNYVLK